MTAPTHPPEGVNDADINQHRATNVDGMNADLGPTAKVDLSQLNWKLILSKERGRHADQQSCRAHNVQAPLD